MIKHNKVNRELLQKTLGENGIKATPTVRSGQTAKLVMTGEDGKVYEVNKDLTVVRVQDEMPARPLLKTHSQSPADRSAVQIRKAAMRTSKYEAVHQSIARHNEAWKNQQRQLEKEALLVATTRAVRGVVAVTEKAEGKFSRIARIERRRLKLKDVKGRREVAAFGKEITGCGILVVYSYFNRHTHKQGFLY